MKIIVAVVLSLLAVAPAAAISVLDQQNIVTDIAATGGDSNGYFHHEQTITAGISGLMGAVAVQAIGLTSLNIFGTTNGVPNDTLLGTSSSATNDLFGFVVFSTNVFVTAGQVFAIEPIGSGGVVMSANTYAEGSIFYKGTLTHGTFIAQEAYDLGFLTYVDSSVTAVPEPALWSTLIIGFCAVGGARRYQSRRMHNITV